MRVERSAGCVLRACDVWSEAMAMCDDSRREARRHERRGEGMNRLIDRPMHVKGPTIRKENDEEWSTTRG